MSTIMLIELSTFISLAIKRIIAPRITSTIGRVKSFTARWACVPKAMIIVTRYTSNGNTHNNGSETTSVVI